MRLNVLSARSTLFAFCGRIPSWVVRGCRTGGARWTGDRGRRRRRRGAGRVRPGHPCLVRQRLRRPDRRADRRLAVGRRWPQRTRGGAHRLGQDARGLPLVTGPARPRASTVRGPPALPRALRQPAQGPRRRRGAQPARPAGRHPAGGHPAGRRTARHHRRHAHRRHARRRATSVRPHPTGHPHHHARVAVPAAHVRGSRLAARRPDGDRRRGARGGRQQTRRPPRPLPRTPRRAAARPGAAHRPLRDRPADRRLRAVPRRRPPGRRGPAGHPEDHRGQRGGPGGGHDPPGRTGAATGGRPRRPRAASGVDLAGRGGAGLHPHRAAPLDHRLHQLPAQCRAPLRPPQRAGRRGGGRIRVGRGRDRRTGGVAGRRRPGGRR
ncbi:hypothetical protein PSN01_02644 [Micromonospora saelicesensis]|nr:hypothetical protein PSN01_02644 [Micromonospora saelicesensis]